MSVPLYAGGKQTSNILGVHQRTLYNWEKTNKIKVIRTPGGKRLYGVYDYLVNNNGIIANNKINQTKKLNICYICVSSKGQIDDLNRQRQVMKEKYKKYIIIEDIGSGINFNNRGLNKIIHYAIEGKINKVVIAYKDRLVRFGYSLIENLIKKYSNGQIIILNKTKMKTTEEELALDILQIMNVFVAKINGLRKYKTRHTK